MTTHYNDDGTITLERQNGCARCGAEFHDDIVYRPFTNPIEIRVGTEIVTLSHWSMCPATDEPILMSVTRAREESDEAAEAAEAASTES
jgi:hypothetical protein